MSLLFMMSQLKSKPNVCYIIDVIKNVDRINIYPSLPPYGNWNICINRVSWGQAMSSETAPSFVILMKITWQYCQHEWYFPLKYYGNVHILKTCYYMKYILQKIHKTSLILKSILYPLRYWTQQCFIKKTNYKLYQMSNFTYMI